jgi:hypothetical protein
MDISVCAVREVILRSRTSLRSSTGWVRIGIQVTVAAKRPGSEVDFMADSSSTRFVQGARSDRTRRAAIVRDERPHAAPATSLMFAGCVLYRIYSLFAGIFCVAGRVVCSPCYLVDLAVGFKFFVARDVPGSFLSFADDGIYRTFNVFLIRLAPLLF